MASHRSYPDDGNVDAADNCGSLADMKIIYAQAGTSHSDQRHRQQGDYTNDQEDGEEINYHPQNNDCPNPL